MSFELFIEVTRNKTVESRHFGAAVVCDFKGNVLQSWGDPDQLIFPRSALKPFLAIDLVESGACDRFGVGNEELALACASHQGEPMHQNMVEAWLHRLGLNTSDLACGCALPDDVEAARNILTAGGYGCKSHHNCSGKHAGFLTNALHLGLPTAGYHQVTHPLQQRATDILSDMADMDMAQVPTGIDGCGFPAPAMPLARLGHAVARFANPSDLSAARAGAIHRLHAAVAQRPLYAAGHGTLVSDLVAVTKGRVLAKTGAEGVLTAAVPERGLGIALKIADGSARPRATALLAILDHLGMLTKTEKTHLHEHILPGIENSRAEKVGEMRPAVKWLSEAIGGDTRKGTSP
jgi:L-asparaginase II